MMMDIEKQLLEAARASGFTIAELTRASGLPYSATHGFLKSGRRLSLRSAAKLAAALELELRPVRRALKRKG